MKFKRYLSLIAIFLTPLFTIAQSTESSPYSAFGLGEAKYTGTVEAIGMGGLNSAFWNLVQTNPSNPASYSFLTFTNYSMSFFSQSTVMQSNADSEKNQHSGINQLVIGIPMGRSGLALGFLPTYATGYDIVHNVEKIDPALALPNAANPYDGSYQNVYNFRGEGGMNRFFIGYSKMIFKGFSLGANVNFDFGNLSRNVRMYTPAVYHTLDSGDDAQSVPVFEGSMYGSRQDESLRIRDWTYDLGILYSTNLSENLQFTIGGTYSIGKDVSPKYSNYLYNFKFDQNGREMPIDTVISFNGAYKNSNVTIPTAKKWGASIGNYEKWMIGFNYETYDRNNLSFGHDQFLVEHKRKRIASVGGYWTPKFNSLVSYWDRVTYRAGVKYEQIGLRINGTDIVDYNFNLGFGLPMRNGLSMINVAASYGLRGTLENNLIKESYFKLMINFSLSDKWFRKVLYN